MKKQILSIGAFALLSLVLVTSGCKKDDADTTSPAVSVVGSNPYYIQKGTTWSDPGATATDDVDGTLAAAASGTVTTSTVGSYTVSYTATDEAGNVDVKTRTVNVVDVDGYFASAVDVSPYPGGSVNTYNETMHLALDGSGKVNLTKFGDYVNGSVYFNLTGLSTLTVPAQTVTCGLTPASRMFSGSGTLSSTAPQVTITFDETTGGTMIHSQDTYTR